MSYFSRLTDIVTCNLSALLAEAADPVQALTEIIAEMREGLAGAKRSVAAATASVDRLAGELEEYRREITQWADKAKAGLMAGRETEARTCLLRKREVLDLIAGLEQQHRAAQATQEHLATMHRALEARLAEAVRRLSEAGQDPIESEPAKTEVPASAPVGNASRQVDEELAALKRQLGLT